MKNKGELKKLIVAEIAAACLFLTAFFFLLYSQYRSYTKNFNERLGAALGALQEYAPEALDLFSYTSIQPPAKPLRRVSI